jgi:glucose/arabinose dehydrogenase
MPVSMKKLALAFAGASVLAGGTAVAAGPPPPTATNGHKVKLVASGLGTPTSFAFGGGTTFEGDAGNNQSGPPNGGVFVLKGGMATKLAGSPQYVAGLAWHKNALYVSGGYVLANGHTKFQLLKWSGWNGTKFTHKRAIFSAPKKLLGLNGIAFGPDGRLYVGAGVGPTEGFDHKPASFAPYLYDILSISPNGKGLKVYASGIRQPWQIAFAPGSKSPFVSGLGQDSGAKNPPDFLFKVKKGDNYGFPQCNHTKGSKCKGFAKPFKLFAPHMDIMGLAIIGKTLYMTSFLGSTGKAGEVFSMPLKGGKLKTVVHGFVAPTVGLGQHAGSLYIGELTGQVFSVRP